MGEIKGDVDINIGELHINIGAGKVLGVGTDTKMGLMDKTSDGKLHYLTFQGEAAGIIGSNVDIDIYYEDSTPYIIVDEEGKQVK